MVHLASKSLAAVVLMGIGPTACSEADREADTYTQTAERIAAIPIEPKAVGMMSDKGPKHSPLRVELMTPHQLWDARDAVRVQAPRVIHLDASDLIDPEMRAEPINAPPEPQVDIPELRTLQLGAYGSQEAAQAAWARTATMVPGLSPIFEPVTIKGRSLVRLKVRVASAQASTLCAQAAASDDWCLRAAS